MNGRRSLLAAGSLLLAIATALPAVSQESFVPYLSVNAAPEGLPVKAGDRLQGSEFTNTRRIADGHVGPAPTFLADDGFGCVWVTAETSGSTGWIGVARRGRTDVEGTDMCPGFQTKLARAAAAGAGGLILVNFEDAAVSGLGAGPLPGMIVQKSTGDPLIAALSTAAPGSIRATFEALDADTGLRPGQVAPTAVSAVQTSVADGRLAVGGTALFRGQGLVAVGTDPAGDSLGGAGPTSLGYDLTEALIGQPNPQSGDFRFKLRLAELPPSGGLPEAARYIWDFGVTKPGMDQPKLLSIEGRFTNVIRGQSQSIPSFILRGNCVTENNVTTCENVAVLEAYFNQTAAEITVTVPYSVVEAQLGSPLAGAQIVPGSICEGISTKVSVYFSVCGDTGHLTGDKLAQSSDTGSYTLATRRVEVGVVPSGQAPAYTTTATLGSGGGFSSSLDVSTLPPGDYDVHVRACYGTNCGTATRQITL